MKRPFFSIIVPTYNSEQTLKYTLTSIENQSIGKDDVEVIVVDGGSTDSTIQMAKEAGAIVINNPNKLPEYAKAIGLKNASGYYALRMDSDEEFSYAEQLNDKMVFLKTHPDIKALIPNRYIAGRKELCGISSAYLNILGDPFNYFIYKTKRDKYETYKKYIIEENKNCAIMRFKKTDIYPLTDSCTFCFSVDYVREQYPQECNTIEFACNTFDRIISDTGLCGCIKGDDIYHNCRSSFKTYLDKCKFRVINNIFEKNKGGFSTKVCINKALVSRKKKFILYALIVPIPIIDSIRLAIYHKDLSFMLHFVYLYYICVIAVFYSFLKVMGYNKENKTYG